MSKKVMNSRLIAAVLLSSTLFAAVPVRAADIAPYEDRDSNALKVAYYFVYPVGKLAELLIFRPLHTISALSQPDPDEIRAFDDDDSLRGCLSSRPTRRCGHSQ
jgi:hypothetical protein